MRVSDAGKKFSDQNVHTHFVQARFVSCVRTFSDFVVAAVDAILLVKHKCRVCEVFFYI